MKHMLVTRFGFPEEYVILVTELEKAPSQRPTKKNILFWMDWLVKNVRIYFLFLKKIIPLPCIYSFNSILAFESCPT